MIIILIIVIVVLLYLLIVYNKLIRQKNRVKQATSGIDVYLMQRFDLIPNLVECVKGYMKYEQETLTKITEMRIKYMKTKNVKEGEELNNECNKIMAISEMYPELKANEQFLNLQRNLTKMESQLQAARRIYNSEVNVYNDQVQMFPSNILANIFGFKKAEFFEAETQARNNVKIEGEI